MKNNTVVFKVIKEAALSKFRNSIKHLILHVTDRCNMSCKHCFVNTENLKNELTLDEIKSVAQVTPDLIWLDIGGGEPLLRKDLEKIIASFNFKELSIPTNGWETDLIVEKLGRIHSQTSGKLIVTLSLDGMHKTHDEIRRPGSFERTLDTFRKLKMIDGLRVKFNTVICEKNYDEILSVMNFVKELQPDFHSILKLRGSSRDNSMKLPSIEKMKSLDKEINRIQQSYEYGRTGMLSRVHKNYQKYKGALNIKTLKEEKQAIQCLAGTSHLVIWPDGGVSPCELLPIVGNLREAGLAKLLAGKRMKEAVSSIRKGACFCTHDCNMIENILFNFRSYPRLLWQKKE